MKLHRSHCLLVEFECFVWSGGKIHVKPHHPSVVASHNDVVTRGMHVDGGQPLAPAHEALGEALLEQVEHLDVLLGDNEEEGARRVEGKRLYAPWILLERHLGLGLGELRGGRGWRMAETR